MSNFTRHVATVLAAIIGILGVVGILYAWRLPPFSSTMQMTEDAYVTGQVTYLSAQVSGAIEEVAVQDFAHVTKGQVLVTIDDTTYRQQLERALAQEAAATANLEALDQTRMTADAQLRSAEAGVASAEAALRTEKADMDRSQALVTRGVTAQQEADSQTLRYEQARTTLDQARAQVDVARQTLASVAPQQAVLQASLKEAQAAVALARIDLDHTRITAPVDGTLGAVSAHVGQYVGAGSRLLSVVPETIWIVANFKETQVGGMRAGQPVTFSVDALDGAEMTGRIERFSPATGSEFSVLGGSNASGNFVKVAHRVPVRISIDADQPGIERLSPGLSVVAHVNADAK